MRASSVVAGSGALVLALSVSASATEDDWTNSELPEAPVVQIQIADPDAAERAKDADDPDDVSDADDDADDDADALDEFQHYIDLIEASEELEEYLANVEYGHSNGTGALIVPGLGRPTSEYGPRVHPISGQSGFHTGLDLSAGDGLIYAADSGTVVQAATNSVYGNFVVLDHGLFDGKRLTTMYAHQPDLQVKVGDRVSKGQAIGEVGSTGLSTGPHLHFEVRLDAATVNPAAFLPPTP
jgi:murein DD-endopeptidase MepM/ murein hydrolase activator NlpD